jgi:hypothetical protein
VSVGGKSNARTPLLVLSVTGLFGYVPAVVFAYFGSTLGAPVALLMTGILLVSLSVGLARMGPSGPAKESS